MIDKAQHFHVITLPIILYKGGGKEIVWEIKGITTYEEPLIVYHPNYRVAWCNVTVEWEIEDTITDCLSIITPDCPFICDFYKNKKNLLLTIKFTLMLRFIGVTFDYTLTKYGKALIYVSFCKSKHQYFGYFH